MPLTPQSAGCGDQTGAVARLTTETARNDQVHLRVLLGMIRAGVSTMPFLLWLLGVPLSVVILLLLIGVV